MLRLRKLKLCLFLFSAVFLLAIVIRYKSFHQPRADKFVKPKREVIKNRGVTVKNRGRHYCRKWIVLTTVNNPTEHVKYLNDGLNGWCVVVSGDEKTAPDWRYKNIFFLSMSQQLEMAKEFEIILKIPLNSYLRKLTGYLFAMQNGAEFIYETDDDNSPLDGLYGFRYHTFRGIELASSGNSFTFVNPYSYFGQTSMWPRGYPLELISESTYNADRRFGYFLKIFYPTCTELPALKIK